MHVRVIDDSNDDVKQSFFASVVIDRPKDWLFAVDSRGVLAVNTIDGRTFRHENGKWVEVKSDE